MRRRTTKEESIAFLVPEKKKLKKMLLLLSNNMRRTKNRWKNPALRDISGGENSLVSRLATRKTKTQAT